VLNNAKSAAINTCYGCQILLKDYNQRLCSTCRGEHAKLEEPFLKGYLENWHVLFVQSRKGKGHKFPDGKWFRYFVKTVGAWREI